MAHRPVQGGLPLMITALATAALSGCGFIEGPNAGRPIDGRGSRDRRPVLFVTAEQMARDYAASRQAADVKYRGKYLQVAGVVDRVRTNSLGERSVALVGFTENRSDDPVVKEIRCIFLPTHDDRTLDLTRGQEVKIVGRCEGEGTSIDIEIVDCELEEVGPDPSITVTAEQLTRAYAQSKEQADQKYSGRQLVIEGVLVELRGEGEGRPEVVLAGHDEQSARPLRVVAAYPSDQRGAFARLSKGQKIKIKGECSGRHDDEVSVSFAVLVRK
ncbi:MAG TPA: hypothetical protein VNK04_05875 [Gemmataceae bacterium]|nr:hypothetical protein [Gemmataceae bacterium]